MVFFKKTKKIIVFLTIFIIIFFWLFSGWPPIWKNPRVPPKTEHVYAVNTNLNSSALSTATRDGSQRLVVSDSFSNLYAVYIDSLNDVYVAFSNDSASSPAGSSWTQMGTAIDTNSARIAAAIDYNNWLHIAVEVVGGTIKYYQVKPSYTGTTINSTGWTIAAAITLETSTRGVFPSIIIDRNNFPAVAWSYDSTTNGVKSEARFSRATSTPTIEGNWTCAAATGCTAIGTHGIDTIMQMNTNKVVHGFIVKAPAVAGAGAWNDAIIYYGTCTQHSDIHESTATVNGMNYNAWQGFSLNGTGLDATRGNNTTGVVDPVNNKTWITWSNGTYNTNIARFDIATDALDNAAIAQWTNVTQAEAPTDTSISFHRTTNGMVHIFADYATGATANPGDVIMRAYTCTAAACSSGSFDSADTIIDATGNATLPYTYPAVKDNSVKQNKDQSYEVDGSSATYNIGMATAASGVRLAQAFQPSSAAGGLTLTQVGVKLKKTGSPTDALKVSVRSSTDGTILAQGFIAGPALTTTASWYYIKLDSGAALTVATTYYLQIERTSTASDTNYYQWSRDTTLLYGSGNAWQYTTSWTEQTATDLDFITYYETYPKIDLIYTKKTAATPTYATGYHTWHINETYSMQGTGLPTGSANATAYFDEADYTNVAADDANITSTSSVSNIPVFIFKKKNTRSGAGQTDTADVSWKGYSSSAESSLNITLAVWNFNTSGWETEATASSDCDSVTQCALTGSASGSNYIDSNLYSYWRVSQASGTHTLNTNLFSLTYSATAASLTFVVSIDNFPTLTPGFPVFATSTLSVNTDNSTGWNVTVLRDDIDTTMDLDTDATVNITDQTAWAPGAATTTAGNATRISSLDSSGDVLAMRVMTASGTASFISTSWWGTTDAYIDSATTLWAGFNSTAKKIGDSSVSSGGSAKLNTVLYYLDAPSSQTTGAYSGGVTYTATMNP